MRIQKIKYGSDRWFNLKNFFNEKWKDIKDYEGLYQISNYGRLKSFRQWVGNRYFKREKILFYDIQNGYYCIKLSNNKKTKYKYIHRLVAEAFVPKICEEKNIVDHLDANKLNNYYKNLDWVTTAENNRRARIMGLTTFSKETIEKIRQNSIKNNNAQYLLPFAELRKRKIYQYDLSGNFLVFYDSIKDAKKIYGNNIHITDCCQGKRNQAGGYIWRYANENNS